MFQKPDFIEHAFPSAEEYDPNDLFNGTHLTVGDLKKFLKENPDLPDDTMVLTQRVNDEYFDHLSWKTVKIQDEEVNFTTKDYSVEEIQNIKKSFSSMMLDPTLVKSKEDENGLYLVNYADHIPNFAIYLRNWDKANKSMVVITPFY